MIFLKKIADQLKQYFFSTGDSLVTVAISGEVYVVKTIRTISGLI
jgi:hypothetical protein